MEVASDEKLAELVREYRFLYDTTHFFYKDLTKKQEAWEDIATRMNVSSELAKNKWKSVREKYMRMKRTCKGTTGQAATKIQRLDYLSFLDEFSKPRETCSNIPTQHSKPATEAGSFEAVFNPSPSSARRVSESVTMSPIPSPPSARSASELSEFTNTGLPTITTGSSNVSATRSPDDTDSSSRSEALETHLVDKLIEYLQRRKQPDEVDLLFASYAETTKKMKPASQRKLKLALAQLVYKIQNEDAQENQEE